MIHYVPYIDFVQSIRAELHNISKGKSLEFVHISSKKRLNDRSE